MLRRFLSRRKLVTASVPSVNLRAYRTMPNPASRTGLAIMHLECMGNIAHIRDYDFWDDLDRLIRQHDARCVGGDEDAS